MRMFKVVVEVGHYGSGSSQVATRHILARNATDAMHVASNIPRVKRVLSVKRVRSLREFLLGLLHDICPIWVDGRLSNRLVTLLIWAAYKLGGV